MTSTNNKFAVLQSNSSSLEVNLSVASEEAIRQSPDRKRILADIVLSLRLSSTEKPNNHVQHKDYYGFAIESFLADRVTYVPGARTSIIPEEREIMLLAFLCLAHMLLYLKYQL